MCSTPFRCVLTIINIIFGICGLAITISGCLLLWAKPLVRNIIERLIAEHGSSMSEQLRSKVDEIVEAVMRMSHQVGFIVLIAGAIILVISFLGCCGACCNNKCFLILYAIIVGMVAIAHIIVLIVWFAKKELPLGLINKVLNESVYKYESVSSGTPESLLLALMMPTLGCCGYINGSDFEKSPNFQKTDVIENQRFDNLKYPIPCCRNIENMHTTVFDICPRTFTPDNSNIEIGCKEKVETVLLPTLNMIAYISIGVLVFEILLLILAVVAIKA